MAPLVVNGWMAEKTRFPWHVVIFSLHEGNWSFICGGSLISEHIILTAAHCTWKLNKDLLRVTLGKFYSDYYKFEDGAQIRSVASIIRQPLYQDIIGNFGSDIAILVTDKPVQFSAFVRPICIDWNLNDIVDHLSINSLGVVSIHSL